MEVRFTEVAAEEVATLPRVIRLRIAEIIERLQKWPAVSGAKPLKGALAGKFRIRTGDYRLQFFVAGDRIVIERVGHRDGFYDE